MVRRFFFILFVAVVGHSAVLWAQSPALPASAVAAVVSPEPEISAVRLLVGRSTVIDVGTPIARVSLTSADIADALVTSPNQLLINGKLPGTISMFVWDRSGGIRRFELVVQRDLSRLSEQVRQLLPGEAINVASNGRDIVLSGTVSSKDIIEKAVNLAAGYVDKKDEVTSLMQVATGVASNQVLLRVRFAEVSRTALTELGASFFTSPTGVKNTLARTSTQQYAVPGFDALKYTKDGSSFGAPVTSAEGKFTFGDFLNFFLFSEKYDLGTMIRALQTKGLFQSLAEPNLVAESGKEASFLAGGEFPIPIAQPGNGGVSVTVQFKEFGVRLNFTPIVQGNRIHLKVRPEVSTLDFANGVVLSGFRVPALSTRRTETELELEDGQTFAIAGLLNNTMNKSLQKVPGIGDIPILGLLFRSEAAQKQRTELVVMITPHILQRNSHGVTTELPRQAEPYLPALPEKKSIAPPPPPFQSGSSPAATLPSAPLMPAMPAFDQPALSPAAAAAAVSALTPAGPKPMEAAPAPPVQAPPPAPAQPTVERPLTADEQKVLDRARREEKEDAKRAAKLTEQERIQAAKEKEREEKLAHEQAKRDADAAKKAAEAARRQAEIEKKQQKALEEAAARVTAAEAAYQAELAKKSGAIKDK